MRILIITFRMLIVAALTPIGLGACASNDGPDNDDEIAAPGYFIDDKLIDCYVEPTEIILGDEVMNFNNSYIFIPDLHNTPNKLEVQFKGKMVNMTTDADLFGR